MSLFHEISSHFPELFLYMISALSPAQIMKIASGNMLLCRFRMDDETVWNLLTNHSATKVDNDATTRLHASILMAGRYAETL